MSKKTERSSSTPPPEKTGQLKLLSSQPKAYGGDLLKTRKGRKGGRPIDTKNTMHMVLRSTKAKGDWSFSRSSNSKKIQTIVSKFSAKYGIRIVSMAYVGNHLHLQIKLGNRHTYRPFVRAITGAIAMAITGTCRWRTKERVFGERGVTGGDRFWDRRPFTRVVSGLRGHLVLKDYIQINRYEGFGYDRTQARFLTEWNRAADPRDRGRPS
jgi:REP element-mobilizing transposase RayT